MPPTAPLRLDFDAKPNLALTPGDQPAGIPHVAQETRPASRGASPQISDSGEQAGRRPVEKVTSLPYTTIFGEADELPPTWSEASTIFHTWSKCTRLQSIRRNRRITGNPGLREHCLNCISIAATHRRG